MKLTCDLCGGALQMNLGGQGATCLNCGLTYSMERLREMLTGNTAVKPEPPKPEPPKPEPEKEVIYDVGDWETVHDPKSGFDFQPEQFVMENNGGRVQQGGIGLGDAVYLDGDYGHPYRVCTINDDPYTTCAKEGMPAKLSLANCPRRVLKNARIVTGNANPVANAYNYPGTVVEYFSNLFRGEFAGYGIHANVPHNALDIPASFMFCKGGKPVLAVFLIHSQDNRGRRQVRKAARIFALEGVACTHFFDNYRNDAPYVIDRIRGVLG